MINNNIDKIYNQFLALRENLPEEKYVSRKYVDSHNFLINQLAKEVNYSLGDFKVSESLLEHTSGIYSPTTGHKAFGEKKCERGLLLMKLDAILLQFRPEENSSSMGFRAPK